VRRMVPELSHSLNLDGARIILSDGTVIQLGHARLNTIERRVLPYGGYGGFAGYGRNANNELEGYLDMETVIQISCWGTQSVVMAEPGFQENTVPQPVKEEEPKEFSPRYERRMKL
jgi:hypothetical protein